jgi:hypothetical protein
MKAIEAYPETKMYLKTDVGRKDIFMGFDKTHLIKFIVLLPTLTIS